MLLLRVWALPPLKEGQMLTCSSLPLLLWFFTGKAQVWALSNTGLGPGPANYRVVNSGLLETLCESISFSLNFYGDPSRAQMRKSLRYCTKSRAIIMLQRCGNRSQSIYSLSWLAKDRHGQWGGIRTKLGITDKVSLACFGPWRVVYASQHVSAVDHLSPFSECRQVEHRHNLSEQ